MIWNFGFPDQQYKGVGFRNQIINFSLNRSLSLSLKAIFNACRSMAGWLSLDPMNVAIVQCGDGSKRSGLVMACFLRYCEMFDSTYESFDYFLQRRSPDDNGWVTVTIRRYLRYFNDVFILNGRVPNPMPLKLHQVILNTVPNFDGKGSCDPGIEVFQNGSLIYSTKVRQGELNLANLSRGSSRTDLSHQSGEDSDTLNDEDEMIRALRQKLSLSTDYHDYDPLVLKDEHHIVFRFDKLILSRDIQVRIYHRNRETGQNVDILNFVFNTGFVAPGLIRLRTSDMDLPSNSRGSVVEPDFYKRFNSEFSADIVVTPVKDPSKHVSYENVTEQAQAKNLLKLAQFHVVRPDPTLIKPLELQGHRKFFARLALQLSNNDIHTAHEFLAYLTKSTFYKRLDGEMVGLSRSRYEKDASAIAIPMEVKGVDETGDVSYLESPLVASPAVAEVPQASVGEKKGLRSLTLEVDEDLISGDSCNDAFIEAITPLNNVEETPLISEALSRHMVQRVLPPKDKPVNPLFAELKKKITQKSSIDEVAAPAANERPAGFAIGKLPSDELFAELTKKTVKKLSIGATPAAPVAMITSCSEPIKIAPPPPPLPAPKLKGPPPPPLPSIRGKVPPPPPLPLLRKGSRIELDSASSPASSHLASSSETINEVARPKIKSKLHWEEIKDQQKLRNTIWFELAEDLPPFEPSQLDIHKFEGIQGISTSEH